MHLVIYIEDTGDIVKVKSYVNTVPTDLDEGINGICANLPFIPSPSTHKVNLETLAIEAR